MSGRPRNFEARRRAEGDFIAEAVLGIVQAIHDDYVDPPPSQHRRSRRYEPVEWNAPPEAMAPTPGWTRRAVS